MAKSIIPRHEMGAAAPKRNAAPYRISHAACWRFQRSRAPGSARRRGIGLPTCAERRPPRPGNSRKHVDGHLPSSLRLDCRHGGEFWFSWLRFKVHALRKATHYIQSKINNRFVTCNIHENCCYFFVAAMPCAMSLVVFNPDSGTSKAFPILIEGLNV